MMAMQVSSIETMGGRDGPGMRCVVFLQGCPLRCLYCHNPETQAIGNGAGKSMSASEIMRVIRRMRPYYGAEGGVTFSGGEPLLQAVGLREVLELCRREMIHTAIDTGGGCASAAALECAQAADLLIVDIKHPDAEKCRRLCGSSAALEGSLALLEQAARRGQSVWVRHVVVPTWSDDEATIRALAERLAPFRSVIKKVELLPYHKLGEEKYAALGREVPLREISAADAVRVKALEEILRFE